MLVSFLNAFLLVSCNQMASEYQLVSVGGDDGSAVEAWEDAQRGLRNERFEYGGGTQTAIADYLFVIDNSSSMDRVLDLVQAGFASLAEDNPFPTEARIAVMYTLPALSEQYSSSYKLVTPAVGSQRIRPLSAAPGFMGFVDKSRIEAYRAIAPASYTKPFVHEGCDSGWFAPLDKNAAGVPCIVAHTQIGLQDVYVEAGLLAFSQLLKANAGTRTFRAGAAVNIIFVSDTHDPGIRPGTSKGGYAEAFIAQRPSWTDIETLVQQDNVVSSIRLHAAAPASECGEKWMDSIGPSYFTAADESGGYTLDICEATDYSPLIRTMAKDGAIIRQAVFPLGRRATDILSVDVDGIPVDFQVVANGKAVVVNSGIPHVKTDVHIEYAFHSTPVKEISVPSTPGKAFELSTTPMHTPEPAGQALPR